MSRERGNLEPGDYYLLGHAIFGAIGATVMLGHGSAAGLRDYVALPEDASWHERIVLDYLTMGRDKGAERRVVTFFHENNLGDIIAEKVATSER